MVSDIEAELDAAFDDADGAGGGLGNALAEQLAKRIGASAKASAVFGEPVSRDGATVIPVAKISYGFGAGGGVGSDDDGEHSGFGSGGGGGLRATPVGYIEIADGRATFNDLRSPAEIWPMVVAGGIASWLILRGLRSILRG